MGRIVSFRLDKRCLDTGTGRSVVRPEAGSLHCRVRAMDHSTTSGEGELEGLSGAVLRRRFSEDLPGDPNASVRPTDPCSPDEVTGPLAFWETDVGASRRTLWH